MGRYRNFQSRLICLALVAGIAPSVSSAPQFNYNLPWEDSDVQAAAAHLPPPPPSPDCYDPSNVGTVGAWNGCNGLLIVEGGGGTFGIHTAVNSGITVNGTTYDATNIFTGQVTSFSGLFQNNISFNADIGFWDTSNVSTFRSMFQDARAFDQDLSGWDTSSVTDMSYMFKSAISFNGNVSSWDVSGVTNMTQMFFYATSFNQDVSSWNTSALAWAGYMFSDADVFNQDIGGWDTSGVGNMDGMFRNASVFNQDLTGWCTTMLFTTPPPSFSDNSALQPANEPVWGTCP